MSAILSVTLPNGKRLEVGYDEGTDSPREWSNVTHMFYPTRHPGMVSVRLGYTQPDGHDEPGPYGHAYEHFRGEEWHTNQDPAETFKRWVRIVDHDAVLTSGGIHRDAPDVIAYIPGETVRKEFGGNKGAALDAARGEIETYRAWAMGEVYNLTLLKPHFWMDEAGGEMTTWDPEEGIGGVYRDAEHTDEDWIEAARLHFGSAVDE